MKYSLYQPNQLEELKHVFHKTFTDSEGEAEGALIGDLVSDLMTTDKNDLMVFVAADNEKIVGSIIFTRMTFENSVNAFLMAPVAVHTDYQGKGVGQALITFGLQTLQEQSVTLVLTYGDPNFYSKVGFTQISEQQVKAPLNLTYPEGWLAQSLVSDNIEPIAGNSSCVEAINKQMYW
ncbi:GNAT family N-acetyltransferase [Photobacterium frigidiphilum]|uniref:GNAT family N-acetyltransferase n=1 Tax=Photobacterium frigidiphilum TaxID=264736 RepID=A0A2T3J7D8_9GAMM|nr:N-acetyltransferase [Photobacterium frigidiphilum]PSU44632.1 GNAT family N-acetyltransferase [Photobacterium frigidiphilum]